MNEENNIELFDSTLMYDMLEKFCEKVGFECEKTEDYENQIFFLDIRMADLGEISHSLIMEVTFTMIPDLADDIVVGIMAGEVFRDLPAENVAAVKEACNFLNSNSVVNTYFVKENALRFKSNLLMNFDHPFEVCFDNVVNQIIMINSDMHGTVDGLALIARGMCTVEDAVLNHFYKL